LEVSSSSPVLCSSGATRSLIRLRAYFFVAHPEPSANSPTVRAMIETLGIISLFVPLDSGQHRKVAAADLGCCVLPKPKSTERSPGKGPLRDTFARAHANTEQAVCRSVSAVRCSIYYNRNAIIH